MILGANMFCKCFHQACCSTALVPTYDCHECVKTVMQFVPCNMKAPYHWHWSSQSCRNLLLCLLKLIFLMRTLKTLRTAAVSYQSCRAANGAACLPSRPGGNQPPCSRRSAWLKVCKDLFSYKLTYHSISGPFASMQGQSSKAESPNDS